MTANLSIVTYTLDIVLMFLEEKHIGSSINPEFHTLPLLRHKKFYFTKATP